MASKPPAWVLGTASRSRAEAAAAGCLPPLSISSEGTAETGGVLATNAGGNNALHYGTASIATPGPMSAAGAIGAGSFSMIARPRW